MEMLDSALYRSKEVSDAASPSSFELDATTRLGFRVRVRVSRSGKAFQIFKSGVKGCCHFQPSDVAAVFSL